MERSWRRPVQRHGRQSHGHRFSRPRVSGPFRKAQDVVHVVHNYHKPLCAKNVDTGDGLGQQRPVADPARERQQGADADGDGVLIDPELWAVAGVDRTAFLVEDP
jgi:hypothetical protein